MNKIWKFIKKRWLLLLILVALVIGAVIYFTRGAKPVEYITAKVGKGTLTQTVSETGAIQAATEIDLNFKGNGTITELNVKEGDEVKNGDVLARLDAGTFEIQVRQAQANVSIARANLNRFLAGASNEDINVTEESVNNALISYENAKRDHEALLTKLDSDIKTYEQGVADRKTNLLLVLDNSATATDHTLDILTDIFDNSDLAKTFGIKDPQYAISATNNFEIMAKKIDSFKNNLATFKNGDFDSGIGNISYESKSLLQFIAQTLDYTFSALTATPSSSYFPEQYLDLFKSDVKLEQANIDSATLNLDNAKQAYDSAKNNLQTAKSSQDLNIANSQSSVDGALGAYNLSKAQLELKIAAPRAVDIAYYQAQVDQASAALDLALSNLDDYIIHAPTDGRIIFVNYDVGEQIGIGLTTSETKPIITILGKGDFEIEVDVPESDIIKIAAGNPVNITLDAYGDEVPFKGNVVFIDLAQTNIQGVVYYKVLVAMEKTDKEIKPGMTANVDILTAEKQGVLYVPIRSVKEDAQKQQYVEILKNGQPEKVVVKTGMRGDQGIEITSGLAEGQEIITYTK